jgi:MSHA biogenesis protein MshJ
MSARLAPLRLRYLGFSRRERGLGLAAVLIVVAGLGELVFIEPALKQRAQLLRQMSSQQAERQSLQQRLAVSSQDPNGALRAQSATLKTQLQATDRQFETMQHGLVQPQHMGALLQSLLTEHRSLQLLGLRTLPVTGIGDMGSRKAAPAVDRAPTPVAAAASGVTADDAWLYRHAVEIKVQGSYADMRAYLQQLEALPRHVHWGDLEIDARNYPLNIMTVTIFTVSLEKSWWIL